MGRVFNDRSGAWLRLVCVVATSLAVPPRAGAEPNRQTHQLAGESLWKECVVTELQGTVRVVKCPDVELKVMRASFLGCNVGHVPHGFHRAVLHRRGRAG
jgi:hypothetical protein